MTVRPPSAPDRATLEAAHAWEREDLVPGRPAMTAFRQAARLHQARWREAHGHPIGSQPIRPRPGVEGRPVGSRLPLDYARETGATFVSRAALAAARAREEIVEREQSIDHQGLWADLLSSTTLAFNLFGDLAADPALADRAVHAWWPGVPGHVAEVRFLHSPGRLDPEWLNSLRQFDAAFLLERPAEARAILAVDTKLHERAKAEQPKPSNLHRYREVHERSGAFRPEAFDRLKGRSELWWPWLEHLLLLSMLQHPSGSWGWGRLVVVHPAGNPDVAGLIARYRDLLADDATFGSTTVEALLEADVLPPATGAALRERYLPGELD